ncbi:MAG: HEAT repeat domain-containing protein, partial [Limisphaerales bacterium]
GAGISSTHCNGDVAADVDVRTPKTFHLERHTSSCNPRPVRRRSKLLLLGACILIALVAVCFFCLRDNEPSYNGRTLSEWLEIYEPTYIYLDKVGRPPKTPEVVEAQAATSVRQIGTNAFPTLLEWNRAKEAVWRMDLFGLANRAPEAVRPKWLVRVLWSGTAERKKILSEAGFWLLQTNAAPVVFDELTRRFNGPDEDDAWVAGSALAKLGIGGLKILVTNLSSTNQQRREIAIQSIGQMKYLGTNAATAIPNLVRNLYADDPRISSSAAETLGHLRMAPDNVVTPLMCAATNTDGETRLAAITALGEFRRAAKQAVPLLLRTATNDSEWHIRNGASNALRRIEQGEQTKRAFRFQ